MSDFLLFKSPNKKQRKKMTDVVLSGEMAVGTPPPQKIPEESLSHAEINRRWRAKEDALIQTYLNSKREVFCPWPKTYIGFENLDKDLPGFTIDDSPIINLDTYKL